jgi:hypothetical protein
MAAIFERVRAVSEVPGKAVLLVQARGMALVRVKDPAPAQAMVYPAGSRWVDPADPEMAYSADLQRVYPEGPAAVF